MGEQSDKLLKEFEQWYEENREMILRTVASGDEVGIKLSYITAYTSGAVEAAKNLEASISTVLKKQVN